MSSLAPSPMPGAGVPDCERTTFVGFLLAVLAFGAIFMLYVQLTQVLSLRPSRDKTFWFIVAYSLGLFPLVMACFVGRVRFAEMTYVLHQDHPGGGGAYFYSQPPPWCELLSQISAIIISCFADLFMFYRLMVLWNRQWKIMYLPAALYLVRIGVSIPRILSLAKPPNARKENSDYIYDVVLASVFVALNLTFTALISFRLFTMRHKVVPILGKLQASLYNSCTTLFIESGALFTIWALIYLAADSRDGQVKPVFIGPYPYIIVLTRMLIVLRVAQDRAWTAEIINAAESGMLNWAVSSAVSIELRAAS